MRAAHLGLDVGGTASRWVACDVDGQELARGRLAGATAHVFNPAERTRLVSMFEQLAMSLAAQGLEASSLAAGLTGFGASVAGDIQALAAKALALPADRVAIMDDIVLAYAAHFQPGEGHLISAGTGSIGVHVGADGQVVRVGGRGILIDDAGSGSWIALQALDRLYRVFDRTGSFAEVDRLAHHLFAGVGGTGWHDVRQYVYAGDRGRIGTLAVCVARSAEDGDAVALDILARAGAELAELATALSLRAGPGPFAFVGGVLDLHPAIRTAIARSLGAADLSYPKIDSALAAARLQRDTGSPWQATLPVVCRATL